MSFPIHQLISNRLCSKLKNFFFNGKLHRMENAGENCRDIEVLLVNGK